MRTLSLLVAALAAHKVSAEEEVQNYMQPWQTYGAYNSYNSESTRPVYDETRYTHSPFHTHYVEIPEEKEYRHHDRVRYVEAPAVSSPQEDPRNFK